MLFKNSKKRFNCGQGNSLSKINNPCNFSVGNNNITYNTFSLKNNMTFCMIPKPRCSNCKK